MSAFTVASASAVVVKYSTRTADQTLRFADALVYLNTPVTKGTKGMSVRDIVALQGADAPVGKSRVALLIKVRRAAPADITADDFAALVKGASDVNRGTTDAADTDADDTVTGEDSDTDNRADVPMSFADRFRNLVTLAGSDADFAAAVLAHAATLAPVTVKVPRTRVAA